MNIDPIPWLKRRWAAFSTGLKMLLILSLGLLPLGIIAILASVNNANSDRNTADLEARALLAVHAQRFALALARNAFTIRAARDAIIEASDPEGICKRTLDRLGNPPSVPGRYALFGQSPPARCMTPNFVPPPIPASGGKVARAVIHPGGEVLDVFLYDPSGGLDGLAEYRRDSLAQAVNSPATGGNFAIELVQGGRTMSLRALDPGTAPTYEVTADFPFANGQYAMRLRTPATLMSATELVVILTPVLMWVWASLVGWIIVQRLLLRPLARVQDVISAYKPGDRGLMLPIIRSPAREIGALGEAFDRVTQTVARHEAELEAAVIRQTRLVREVHHRVKNNLQVVASLLNLHARGSKNQDVAAAYASIQRRVDALAVVHRNHYAELEANRGVALRPLISELAANLRATAPANASAMQIALAVAPVYTTQDVAVSVAFLITEIVEFSMLCGAKNLSVVLETESEATARLSVEALSLVGTVECDEALSSRFERIITGLARQLRSALDLDPARGRYSVIIGILAHEPASE